jgi:hypothetical protein
LRPELPSAANVRFEETGAVCRGPTVRRSGGDGPSAGVPSGPHGPRGWTSGLETRGSSPAFACSVGRCASPGRSFPSLRRARNSVAIATVARTCHPTPSTTSAGPAAPGRTPGWTGTGRETQEGP